MSNVVRGEVWWADLPEPVASEPGYRRPVLIVQDDAFNLSRIRTVIAVALTTSLRLADAPGNVLLEEGEAGLPRTCVANVSQLLTIDKSRLTERSGTVGEITLGAVKRGLKLILALS